MQTGKTAGVRPACAEFLSATSGFYGTPECGVCVLAARPLRVREYWATELFGDYDPATMLIRLWMRTGVRKDIASFGTFLSTLCHEFCHHLGFQLFKFSDSWHTWGFYERTAAPYHHRRARRASGFSGLQFRVDVTGSDWRGQIGVLKTHRAAAL